MMRHDDIFTPELFWYKRVTQGGSDSKCEEFGNKTTSLQKFRKIQND